MRSGLCYEGCKKMKKMESLKRIMLLFMSAICIAGQTYVFAYVWFDYYSELIWKRYYMRGHVMIIAFFAILLLFFSRLYGGLRIGYLKTTEVVFSEMFATICVDVIIYFVIVMLSLRIVPPQQIGIMFVIQALFDVVWINLCTWIYRNIFPPRDLLVIYGDRPIEDILAKFDSRKDKYNVCKCMNISEGVEKICTEACERYDAIVLWDLPSETRNKILKFCYGKSIRVYLMPKIPDVIVKGAEQLHLFDTPILLVREYQLTLEERFFKRLIDIVCSLILTVIAAPFMLITALLVKLYDGGPVFYKQVRCTVDCREFKILKFRSMRQDAEKDGVARLAKQNDDRITPIGRIIRKIRFDELPQLLNILKGDMSFIGPRPERPEIIKQYLEEMPEFIFRTKVKAGLAGYAQVYGKYNTTPYDKSKLDLFYIENYSLWMDLKLMLLTLKILFNPESTEGISDTQVTALKSEEDK